MEKKARVEGVSSSSSSSSHQLVENNHLSGPIAPYRYFYPHAVHRQLESTFDPVTGDVVFWFNYFSPGVCYYVWFNHFIHEFLGQGLNRDDYRELYPQALLLYHMTAASAGRADIVICRPEYRLNLPEAQRVLLLHTLLCGRLALASDVCNMYFGHTLFEATPAQLELLAVKSPIHNNWGSFVKLTEDTTELKYQVPTQTRRGLSVMHSAMSSLFTTPEILELLEKIYPEIRQIPSHIKEAKIHNRFTTGLLSVSWADAFLSRTLEEGLERHCFVGEKELLDQYVRPLIPDIRVILKRDVNLSLHPCYKKHLFADPVTKVPHVKPFKRPTGGVGVTEDHWPHVMYPPTSMRQRNEIQEWVSTVLHLAIDYVENDPDLSQVKIGHYAPHLCMIEKLRYLKSRGMDVFDMAMVMINVSKQWKYDESTLTILSPRQMKALCKVYDEGEVRVVQDLLAKKLNNPSIRLVWDPLDPAFLPFQFYCNKGRKRKVDEERETETEGSIGSPLTITTMHSLVSEVDALSSAGHV